MLEDSFSLVYVGNESETALFSFGVLVSVACLGRVKNRLFNTLPSVALEACCDCNPRDPICMYTC